MAQPTRRKWQVMGKVVAIEDAHTTSRNENVAGKASAYLLCGDLLTKYAAHVADQGASAGEHKALHTAGVLASAATPVSLTELYARVNDLTAKYALHDIDAAAAAPTYHIAQDTAHALAAETAVSTLAGAIVRLNDIKAKYDAHDAESTAHRTGATHASEEADAALGAAIDIADSNVLVGDRVTFAILNDGTGNVTGVSGVAVNGAVRLTFSADPQDDAIVTYTVARMV